MRFRWESAVTRRCVAALALVSLFILPAAPPAAAYQPSPVPDRVILNWTEDPSTGFSVTWRTNETTRKAFAEIVPAEDDTGFDKKAQRVNALTAAYETDAGRASSHRVTFRGLMPDTLYAYRVGDGAIWSEWNQLRTASAKPEPLTFVYFGDVQIKIHSLWSRVVRQAYSMAPEARFMVFAGDLINRREVDREWGEWHEAGGWIFRLVPSFPAVGNHEYGSSKQLTPNWRAQFTPPSNGVPGLEGTNYYMDIQGLRMIALNSNLKQKEQAEWLDRLLANNPNRWTAVAFHHPIYSTRRGRDNPELRETWQPVFDKYGVDLVLQGHDHTYGRTNLQTSGKVRSARAGTIYVVSMSGAKMYTLGHSKVFARTAEDTQLFQIVRIQGDTLRFECRTASGALYDAFTLQKRSGKPNKLTNQIPATLERVRANRQ
ncbi:MAG: metallophosphoesterase family protein [Acidobacteriales bacterium]|nr:metallophosphoesterase family protein [Terriglobales bacterium]